MESNEEFFKIFCEKHEDFNDGNATFVLILTEIYFIFDQL